MGAYLIGKERIFKAIAEALDCKLWADNSRVGTWKCLEDGEVLGRLVADRRRAQVQVISNNLITAPKLGTELDKVRTRKWRVGCETFKLESQPQDCHQEVIFLEVPYLEHSSFGEENSK